MLYILLHSKDSESGIVEAQARNIEIIGVVCSFKRIVNLHRMLVEIR